MTPRYSPGPWTVVAGLAAAMPESPLGDKDPCLTVEAADELVDVVAEVWWRMGYDDRKGRAEANARLIAAAPDLVEALEAAGEHLEACVPTDGWGLRNVHEDNERADILARVRAALTKAGVQP